jgi:integrase
MALTAKTVAGLKAPGKYGDGDGLWLVVSGKEQRSWMFRFSFAGKVREMGLGSARHISLAQARALADAARRKVIAGIDPIADRRAKAEPAPARGTSFAEAARSYIGAHEAAWRNEKHRQQWNNTLATYASPVIGDLACSEITVDHVLRILEPIWTKKPETARRVRGRIETILAYATVRKWREGPNPAVWRGHLQLMLPSRAKVARVKHHAALDWREASAFMAKLREQDGMGALALEFAILTAARSGEVRGATWAEIDLDEAVWTVPAERMKAGKEHRVPLSARALAVLDKLRLVRAGEDAPIFPGAKQIDGRDQPLSDMTLTAVLRRMGRSDVTQHGFRSTFRDWAAETTHHPNHVVELALAHAIPSAVEAAYRRGELLEKRKALMNDWASHLAKPPAKIVPLRPGAGKAKRGPQVSPVTAGQGTAAKSV